MEEGLPLVRKIQPVLPQASLVSALLYDGITASLTWSTDQGPGTDYWDIELPELDHYNKPSVCTRVNGLQLYSHLDQGNKARVTNIFLPVCHTYTLHRNLLVTVSVAGSGSRVRILNLRSRQEVSRVLENQSFRAVCLQDGLIIFRQSIFDRLLLYDLFDFMDQSRTVNNLKSREIDVGWQNLWLENENYGWIQNGKLLCERDEIIWSSGTSISLMRNESRKK